MELDWTVWKQWTSWHINPWDKILKKQLEAEEKEKNEEKNEDIFQDTIELRAEELEKVNKFLKKDEGGEQKENKLSPVANEFVSQNDLTQERLPGGKV